MAYNVKNQDDFNNLNPQDKITYLSQNQNSDIYKNELNRVNGILGQNPNNAGALDWYSRVQAANSGVSADAINNNTYDPTKWQYQNPANGVGIRNTMVGMGMDNSKIGWRSDPGGLGTVTYDGKDFMQANSLNNGTSYAANANDVYGAAVNYWKGTPNQLVDVTDYAANKQLPFNLGYQDETGNVMVGGIAAKPSFVINGNAYMSQSQLDELVNQAMQNSNLQNNIDIWKKYDDKYTPMTDALLDKIVNRKEFDYDPEQDIAYRAYRDQYNREGDKSLRDTMGNMAGLTGGFINSAAVTAGAQAEQQWKNALMDRIPELAQIAYDRYVGDYNMNRNALSDVQNQHNQAFNREYGVNRDTMDDIRYNNALNVARDDKNYDRRWNEGLYADDQAWKQKQWDREGEWHQDDQILKWQNVRDNNYWQGKNFDEGVRQFDTTFNEDVRRNNRDFAENQRQFNVSLSRSGSRGSSSSGSKKSSGNGYSDEGSSGISAESQKLHDEIDAKLRSAYGLGINQVSAETQAGYVISSNYPDEVKDELLTAMAIPDNVIDQVIKDYQRRSR